MGLAHHPNVVTDGLVCCWDGGNRRCGTPSAGGSWAGLGVNAPATLVNQAEFEDISLGAILLDGTDDKVTVANTTDIDGAGGFTFDIWLYFLGMDSSSKYTVFSLHNSGGGAGEEFAFWIMDLATHAYTVRAGKRTTTGGVGTNRRSNDPALQPSANVGKWANWTFTYSGGDSAVYSSYKIYYNGEEKDDGTMGGAGNGGEENANRWGLDRNDAGDFDGYIGRVALYNKELTAAEILQNYEDLKPRFEPRITKSGLVGNWDAGDPDCYVGGLTCKDTASGTASTLENNGTNLNFNSANGGYWEFDGTDDYIQCSTNSVLQPQSLSLEAWVKDDNVLRRPIAGWNAGSVTPSVWSQYKGSLRGPLLYMNSSDWRYFSTFDSVDEWHHFVFTYTYEDTTTGVLYIDGASIGVQSTADNNSKASTDTFRIGRANTYYYEGSIALVRMYDRPLSAAEVMDNFQKTRGRFGV